MGLFDSLGGSKDIKLTPQAALILSAMTMIGIDGDIDDDEVSILQRLDRGNRRNDWDVAHKAWKKNKTEDIVPLVVGALDESQQLTTIANLIDIAMADGELDGDEKVLLEAFVEAFSISGSDVENIVKVISIKNNKSIFS